MENLNKEIWKDIKGYEGYYQVSNFGRVRSMYRLVFNPNCSNENKSNLRILKSQEIKSHYTRGGYKSVSLYRNNVGKQHRLCRLVAINFIENIDNKPCVNHIDGNKENDNVDNLEWVTYTENMVHAVENNLVNNKYGSDHAASMKVINDGDNVVYGSIKEAALAIGISRSHLSRVLRGMHPNNTGLRLL